MINKRPEILAPCGNPAAFRAALSAGADAVYLASDRFGARAYAGNFTRDELLQTIEEAHLHDVKVYLTLNTLLKDEELRELPELLDPLYKEGLDACLVQDLGVYRVLRERYPELELHASTQMNLCSLEGAAYAKSLGFSRVVPARELTLAELRQIREKVGIEVEAFVHGAMCFCYSGRCYLSSFAGGRSGNRGRCAQPCRELYNNKYLFSMKDLCTLESVPDLVEAGIDSLKIEGRMKNEYYVAACVDAYREMVDDCMAGDFRPEKAARYRERLTEVFHRGGFTGGYLFNTGGPDMLDEVQSGHAGVSVGTLTGIGKGEVNVSLEKDLHAGDSLEILLPKGKKKEPVRLTAPKDVPAGKTAVLRAPRTGELCRGLSLIRTRNAALTRELEERFLKEERKLPIRMWVKLKEGEPFSIGAAVDITLYDNKNGEQIPLSAGNDIRREADADYGDASSVETTAFGDIPDIASGRPVTDDMIRQKIGTLSDTEYRLTSLTIENDGNLFLSASQIKQKRREVLEQLRELILSKKKRDLPAESGHESSGKPYIMSETHPDHELIHDQCTERQDNKHGSFDIAFISTVEDFRKLPTDRIDACVFDLGLSWMDPEDILKLRRTTDPKVKFLIGFPYIYRTLIPDDRMEELLTLAEALDGAYISGIDSFAWLLKKMEQKGHAEGLRTVFLGAALYAYNGMAAIHFSEAVRGFAKEIWMEAPYELSAAEIDRIPLPENVQRITSVYGRLPMMITMQRSNGTGQKEFLHSARGRDVILYRNPEMCYNVILSGLPVLQDAASGGRAYHFTNETKETVEGILSEGASGLKGIRHQGLL